MSNKIMRSKVNSNGPSKASLCRPEKFGVVIKMKNFVILVLLSLLFIGCAAPVPVEKKNGMCDNEKLEAYYKDPSKIRSKNGSKIRGKDGKRTLEEVAFVTACKVGEIYSAYNTYLRKNIEIQGKVVIVFTIQPDGKVSNAVVAESTIDDKGFLEEMVIIIKNFKFASGGVDPLTVTYPIELL